MDGGGVGSLPGVGIGGSEKDEDEDGQDSTLCGHNGLTKNLMWTHPYCKSPAPVI